jgi:hypothetical protein
MPDLSAEKKLVLASLSFLVEERFSTIYKLNNIRYNIKLLKEEEKKLSAANQALQNKITYNLDKNINLFSREEKKIHLGLEEVENDESDNE